MRLKQAPVSRFQINDSTHCIGEKLNTNPFCSTALDSAFMLHLASKGNHDDFCLSYAWTYRDFADGVLGLAWMAKSYGESNTLRYARYLRVVMHAPRGTHGA